MVVVVGGGVVTYQLHFALPPYHAAIFANQHSAIETHVVVSTVVRQPKYCSNLVQSAGIGNGVLCSEQICCRCVDDRRDVVASQTSFWHDQNVCVLSSSLLNEPSHLLNSVFEGLVVCWRAQLCCGHSKLVRLSGELRQERSLRGKTSARVQPKGDCTPCCTEHHVIEVHQSKHIDCNLLKLLKKYRESYCVCSVSVQNYAHGV